MHERYGDRATFLTIYIKEAHPEDEWQMTSNEKEGVCYRQPKSLEDRFRIVRDFVKRFDYPIPVLVDGIDDAADQLYAGWPERFYILDESGTIVYKGGMGPFEFKPEEVEDWLARRFPS